MIGWPISRSLLESFRPGHLRRSRFPGSQPSRLIGGLPARPWERPSALRALDPPASSPVTLFHSCNVITATARNQDAPFTVSAPLGPADSSPGILSLSDRIGFHTPARRVSFISYHDDVIDLITATPSIVLPRYSRHGHSCSGPRALPAPFSGALLPTTPSRIASCQLFSVTG